MIIEQLLDGNPFISENNLVVRLTSKSLPAPKGEVKNDIDFCGRECKYTELVFGSTDVVWYKNDKNSFLYQRLVPNDTIVIELHKDCEKLVEITNNTLGKYYSSFPNQPLYTGFIIDWRLVLSTHGPGNYSIIAVKNILGVESIEESHTFQLLPYSDKLADKTVRIEGVQTGQIFNGLNYTDLLNEGWYSSYRIKGFFGFKDPTLEIDNYMNNDRKKIQIQDSVLTNWTLETQLLPSYIADFLIYNTLLSNSVKITDYNIMNKDIYRRVDLYPSDISEVINPTDNRKVLYTIKFSEKTEGNFKTNTNF